MRAMKATPDGSAQYILPGISATSLLRMGMALPGLVSSLSFIERIDGLSDPVSAPAVVRFPRTLPIFPDKGSFRAP